MSGNFHQFSGPILNGSGHTAFIAKLIGLGINESKDDAIYAEINGELTLIAREGSSAAGTANGVVYDGFSCLSMNSSGQLVFIAQLDGSGVTQANDTALFVSSLDQPQLIAREGFLFDVNDDPGVIDFRFVDTILVGGLPSAVNSGGQDGRRTAINDAGQVVFKLGFTDSSSGVFIANYQLLLGDINCDGVVNLLDVAPFIDLITNGSYLPQADVNGDGVVDLLDVAPFVDLLTG